MCKLAINGGEKVRSKPFPGYNSMDSMEIDATRRIIESGVLSRFLGMWHDDFYGGEQVRSLEKEWAEYFNVKHAVCVNSATSGLIAAVGAAGIGPGDEVIVSPYTMSASASCVLFYGAIPVFSDIEEEYYCLDPKSVENLISDRTKAIIVVDIFGQPYDKDRINAIAKKHNLIVIEDAAQAPGALYGNEFAGTLGDMGIFSLNYHKHIHSGEGGMVVTNNDKLAERLKLIRNHAESVVEKAEVNNLCNMVGFNFRMTEIEATIAREQLKKLSRDLDIRRANVDYFENGLKNMIGITPMKVRENTKHVYYQHILEYNEDVVGISRSVFVNAVRAELMHFELRETEGVKLGEGYVKPLYLLPLFQNRIAIGKDGWPFTLADKSISYELGICPVCEKKHFTSLIAHEFIIPSMRKEDIDDVIKAFWKVYENRNQLKLKDI